MTWVEREAIVSFAQELERKFLPSRQQAMLIDCHEVQHTPRFQWNGGRI